MGVSPPNAGALKGGEQDPEVLTGLAEGALWSKIPELVTALTGRVKDHHGLMARLHPHQIDVQSSITGAFAG